MHKFTGSVVTVVVLCVMMNAQMGSHEQSLSPILSGQLYIQFMPNFNRILISLLFI